MSFVSERPVKAIRKARKCCGCRQMVEVGQPAIVWAGMKDGDFGYLTYHRECRAAEIGLNRLHDTRWDDEWSTLRDMEFDDWPWLLEEYPAVAARFDITAERIAEVKAERARISACWEQQRSTIRQGGKDGIG